MELKIAFALNTEETFEKRHFGDADQIIHFLKCRGVSILVSRQFGSNIKYIVNHFIPVVIRKESPEEVKKILLKQSRWVEEELDRHPDRYKMFTVDNGILNTEVGQNE